MSESLLQTSHCNVECTCHVLIPSPLSALTSDKWGAQDLSWMKTSKSITAQGSMYMASDVSDFLLPGIYLDSIRQRFLFGLTIWWSIWILWTYEKYQNILVKFKSKARSNQQTAWTSFLVYQKVLQNISIDCIRWQAAEIQTTCIAIHHVAEPSGDISRYYHFHRASCRVAQWDHTIMAVTFWNCTSCATKSSKKANKLIEIMLKALSQEAVQNLCVFWRSVTILVCWLVPWR